MALDEAQQHRKHYQARLKEQEANIAQMKKRIQDLQADIEVSGVGGWGGGGFTQLCIVALEAPPSLLEIDLNPALLSGRKLFKTCRQMLK